MLGKHRLVIANKRVTYELEIDRKVTVIKGNSGTGKTTLIRMLQGFIDQGSKSGLTIQNTTNVSLLVFTSSTNWIEEFKNKHKDIIFIDESVDYIYTKSFQTEFLKSDNYLVVISRSGKFNHLPFSVLSIYELRTELNNRLKTTRMYRLYSFSHNDKEPKTIISEDSNSGAEMYGEIFSKSVITANGNGNVTNKLLENLDNKATTFVIVDGAAFGGFIAQTMNLASLNSNISIFAPESFEYLILKTDSFKKKLTDELENTWKYCDSSKYYTWEQYYTSLLERLCLEDFGFAYNKRKLHKTLLNEKLKTSVKANLLLCLCKTKL